LYYDYYKSFNIIVIVDETKDELEINMKFATRCLISSLNIEFLTTIGKPKKLYTPRSAKSSREFTKGMIEEEPELNTNNITSDVKEAVKYDSRKRVSKVPTIETDDLSDESNLNNTLNSIDDRFKDKNFNKNYSPKVSNMRHSPSRTDRSERVFVPLNDIKYNEEEDDEAQDTLGELRSNDDCIPFPSLSQTTTTFEPKAPPNTPSDDENGGTISFPTSNTNTENTEPFPSSNSSTDEDTIPFPSSNIEENSVPFPSSNPEENSIPFPSSNPEENSIPFPSSNPEENSIPFPSSNPEENSIPFPSSNHEENSIPFPSSNPEENSIPFPSSNPEENSIPFPSSIPEENSVPFPSSNSNKKEEAEPFPSSNSKTNEDTVPFPSSTPKPNLTNKRSSAVPKQKPILEKKLNGGRKGRRRSISSPPPPFPDLNTTLNVPSNDEGDNDVLCHLRDIDVQVTYMKGYSSYTVSFVDLLLFYLIIILFLFFFIYFYFLI